MKKIIYIGTKPIKADNVAKTNLTWARGQVHEVNDDKQADLLLEHKHVWADAEKPYEMVHELAIVQNDEPAVVVKNDVGTTDNFVLTVPNEIAKQLHSKELVPVFMTPQDADEFELWKLDRDTSPQETGPTVDVRKRIKTGLERKAS